MSEFKSDEERRLARARLPEGLRPETLAVRTALAPSQHGENSEGLFLSTSFVQPSAEVSAQRFANSEDFTYGRTSNPTVRSLEARLAAMEGTEGAVATASGMGAIAAIWPEASASLLDAALADAIAQDTRLLAGRERGGRMLGAAVVDAVLTAG